MNENQVSLKTLFLATVICAIAARIWSVIQWTPALTILGVGCLASFLASYLFHRATLSAILSGLAATVLAGLAYRAHDWASLANALDTLRHEFLIIAILLSPPLMLASWFGSILRLGAAWFGVDFVADVPPVERRRNPESPFSTRPRGDH
jgi:hypothetical protein